MLQRYMIIRESRSVTGFKLARTRFRTSSNIADGIQL
jgi:hypothetical protein